jgi:hypothetical protein
MAVREGQPLLFGKRLLSLSTLNVNTHKMKLLGYVLFTISCLMWCVIISLPFLLQDVKKIVGINAILIIVSEGCFVCSIFILGKPFWQKINSFFKKTIVFLLCSTTLSAQSWQVSEEIMMPEAVTNTAVTEGFVGDTACVYVFGGLDATKQYSGIHQRSYRYNTVSKKWLKLPNLPDTLGKIAAAATYLNGKIYHLGGYHVFANKNEKSSNMVHIFDCKSNTYAKNGKPIPVAIDDHVQVLWRDSLIYVIAGWSNTTNVPNVQIYNPKNDTWLVGTPLPNNNTFKSFGASGVIYKDTIFYLGGASLGSNYPAQNSLRKGIINPSNPTQITWTSSVLDKAYRAVATLTDDKIAWLGGSDVTYNYDGIAYNGSGGVAPSNKSIRYNPKTTLTETDKSMTLPMDLRGIAAINDSVRYIAGGMEKGQKVSQKLLRLTLKKSVSTDFDAALLEAAFDISPNPSHEMIYIKKKSTSSIAEYDVKIIDATGRLVQNITCTNDCSVAIQAKGIYFIRIFNKNALVQTQKMVIE